MISQFLSSKMLRSLALTLLISLVVIDACAPHSPKRGTPGKPPKPEKCPAIFKHIPIEECMADVLPGLGIRCAEAVITPTSAGCKDARESLCQRPSETGKCASQPPQTAFECKGKDWWLATENFSAHGATTIGVVCIIPSP